jgi:hypothetical protein
MKEFCPAAPLGAGSLSLVNDSRRGSRLNTSRATSPRFPARTASRGHTRFTSLTPAAG